MTSMKNLSKVFLLCFITLFAFAAQSMGQGKNITGQVVDALNESMPGVNVQVKGTTNGTITNIDGKFSISVPNSKSVLVFTFIGYSKQEIVVGNQTKINVQLKEDAQNLDEVVVVGYGTAKKSDLTGATASLRPDANDASKAVSIDGLLQGKIAGLNVTASMSTPGAASSVTIRGANSLRGDNQPLYVIDNVPQASTGEFAESAVGGGDFQIAQDPLSAINPNDIEDITVLKDASATAIYGSRGANGVILITTKKGKAGKAKVNVTANFTIANARNLHDMLNLEEYADYTNSKLDQPRYYLQPNGEMRYVFSGNESAYQADPNNPELYKVITYRNWQKEAYTSAFSQVYSASVSGGTASMKYYISGNFKDINGIVENTGIKQGDLRANLTAELSKKVTLNLILSGSLKQNDMMTGGNTTGGVAGSLARTVLDTAPYIVPDDDPGALESKMNVFSWVNDYDDITNNKTFNGSLNLNWNINKYFSYSLRAGGNIIVNDRKRWYGIQLPPGENVKGLLAISNVNKSNYTVENLLNFNMDLTKDFRLSATAGITYDEYHFLTENVSGNTFSIYDLRTKGLSNAGKVDVKQPIQKDYQLLSYLGRVNLSAYDKYLLTASLRADGSSKFKKGNRWAYFPSFSLAWRMEQEAYMKSIDWLSQLKVRVGYGETGNQGIDPYQSLSIYENKVDYADGDGNKLTSMQIKSLQNEGLKWERTSSWNVGLDFGFFNGRLNGAFDYYRKNTKDLLVERALPYSSGFATVMINEGSLLNKGFEFSLNADIIRSNGWKWNVGGNIGFNKTTIENLGLEVSDIGSLKGVRGYLGKTIGDHFGPANVFIEGEAPGLFFGYKTQGIIQEEDVVDGKVGYISSDGSTKYYTSSVGNDMAAGNIKCVDVNEDGIVDPNDMVVIGDPNPDFTYGFQTRLEWKNLSLSASFTGVYGNDILNTNIRYEQTPSRQAGNLRKDAYYNAWTPENRSNLYPSSTSNVKGVVYDRYVEDGSYLRCSDITLNYILPKAWMTKIGFQNTSIFASVKNAFVITNYSGYDPEVNSFAFDGLRRGIDMNAFPNMRSFVFGLNVTF
jgi:TonB-linked SusC/RagA family outer membrane protein